MHTHMHTQGWRNCTLPARVCERLHAQRVYMATCTPCMQSDPISILHKFNDVITHEPMMSRGRVLLTESVCVPRSETLVDSVVLV
jgi:hypothetical protein